jgi:hypothetical protein
LGFMGVKYIESAFVRSGAFVPRLPQTRHGITGIADWPFDFPRTFQRAKTGRDSLRTPCETGQVKALVFYSPL